MHWRKVSTDGVITVEGQYYGDRSRIVEGMQFDRGYISAYMATDTEKMGLSWKILIS